MGEIESVKRKEFVCGVVEFPGMTARVPGVKLVSRGIGPCFCSHYKEEPSVPLAFMDSLKRLCFQSDGVGYWV